jgi:CheY-like chemotaxis protein/anti-sigma regulatory factor (Ser/Thr protein kinase)
MQAQLVEDLLDISRVITGKLVLNARPVEVGQVVEAAVDSVRAAAAAKRIQIAVQGAAGGSAWVAGDASRLQQVVWNLLSNAVKFTPRDGRVQVAIERADSQVRITVRDSGTGIRPEFLPHVFDRFTQASTSSERRYGGLGLGLAIVRHLVELHGGTVRAESPGQDQGATFMVTLPAAAVGEDGGPPRPSAAGEATPAAPMLDGVRVLVVEDDEDTRDVLARVLSGYGAELRSCATSQEALEALAEWRPSVLVSDIGMPERDGYALIRAVRALAPERGCDVPAVALTAYATSDDRTRALTAGFQMHVPKPVEPLELATVIASLVGRTGRRALALAAEQQVDRPLNSQ